MNQLTELIRDDMRPALGVTEPGAIAFAVATAKKHTDGEVCKVNVALNSGMWYSEFQPFWKSLCCGTWSSGSRAGIGAGVTCKYYTGR